ncbi:hypothetical protein BS50DRAFT_78161 [Corynespora cassiicola Philippines]|uniref:Uncharacterized protein n=1 Tax=Corynespora cassiicola Philippines TaxID=1448308 RepID=A0A2T2NGN6_CORCC|nr:hypothetical protein BS50DRAFT_78161 [Corynespora cassiicola Philippines]
MLAIGPGPPSYRSSITGVHAPKDSPSHTPWPLARSGICRRVNFCPRAPAFAAAAAPHGTAALERCPRANEAAKIGETQQSCSNRELPCRRGPRPMQGAACAPRCALASRGLHNPSAFGDKTNLIWGQLASFVAAVRPMPVACGPSPQSQGPQAFNWVPSEAVHERTCGSAHSCPGLPPSVPDPLLLLRSRALENAPGSPLATFLSLYYSPNRCCFVYYPPPTFLLSRTASAFGPATVVAQFQLLHPPVPRVAAVQSCTSQSFSYLTFLEHCNLCG